MAQFVGFSIAGSLIGWVGEDLLVGPFPSDQIVTQFSPHLADAPSGGTTVVRCGNAASGGGDGLQVTFADGEYNQSVTGSFTISSGGYAYIRVISDAGGGLSLGGFFIISSAVPTVDIANEPLTLGEVKLHCQVPNATTEHDSDLENLIARTREEAEQLTGIPIVSQTVSMAIDKFPSGGGMDWWDGVREGAVTAGELGELELPPGNLQSVSALTTYDDSDAATVMSNTLYFSDLVKNRIILRSGQSWPYVARVANGIVVTLVMGYATPSVVPAGLKELMKERVGQRWSKHPETAEPIHSSFYGIYARHKLGVRNPGSRRGLRV